MIGSTINTNQRSSSCLIAARASGQRLAHFTPSAGISTSHQVPVRPSFQHRTTRQTNRRCRTPAAPVSPSLVGVIPVPPFLISHILSTFSFNVLFQRSLSTFSFNVLFQRSLSTFSFNIFLQHFLQHSSNISSAAPRYGAPYLLLNVDPLTRVQWRARGKVQVRPPDFVGGVPVYLAARRTAAK